MKKLLSLTLFILLFSNAFSQKVSYSFEGKLDFSQLTNLEKECLSLDQIAQAKVKYKEDSQKGEIIIILSELKNQRAESDGQFKAASLKQLMIKNGLNPLEFRILKD